MPEQSLLVHALYVTPDGGVVGPPESHGSVLSAWCGAQLPMGPSMIDVAEGDWERVTCKRCKYEKEQHDLAVERTAQRKAREARN